jgi:hypothetical protein
MDCCAINVNYALELGLELDSNWLAGKIDKTVDEVHSKPSLSVCARLAVVILSLPGRRQLLAMTQFCTHADKRFDSDYVRRTQPSVLCPAC